MTEQQNVVKHLFIYGNSFAAQYLISNVEYDPLYMIVLNYLTTITVVLVQYLTCLCIPLLKLLYCQFIGNPCARSCTTCTSVLNYFAWNCII